MMSIEKSYGHMLVDKARNAGLSDIATLEYVVDRYNEAMKVISLLIEKSMPLFLASNFDAAIK